MGNIILNNKKIQKMKNFKNFIMILLALIVMINASHMLKRSNASFLNPKSIRVLTDTSNDLDAQKSLSLKDERVLALDERVLVSDEGVQQQQEQQEQQKQDQLEQQ